MMDYSLLQWLMWQKGLLLIYYSLTSAIAVILKAALLYSMCYSFRRPYGLNFASEVGVY